MRIKIGILAIAALSLSACYGYWGAGPYWGSGYQSEIVIEREGWVHCTVAHDFYQSWTRYGPDQNHACDRAMHACRMKSPIRWSHTCKVMR